MKANHNKGTIVQSEGGAVAYEQRYNKWKQITTEKELLPLWYMLLPMSKDTINESKSQQRAE